MLNRYRAKYIDPEIIYKISAITGSDLMDDANMSLTLKFSYTSSPTTYIKTVTLPWYSQDGNSGHIKPGTGGVTHVIDGITVTCSYWIDVNYGSSSSCCCGSSTCCGTVIESGYKLVINLNGAVPYSGSTVSGMIMTVVVNNLNDPKGHELTHSFECDANVDNSKTPTSNYA